MNKKCKNTKNCQYFGNGSKYHKLLKILALGAMFKFWMIIGFKLYKNIFFVKNFEGSKYKFRQQV